MDIVITDNADEDLSDMDEFIRSRFDKHILKIVTMRPTRFFKNVNIEHVGEHGRIIYHIDREDDVLYILRCFTAHKEYEKWRNSHRKT
jgi:mRNA-degrading endonuclease RelE of RelBE toxin-antitoxin system